MFFAIRLMNYEIYYKGSGKIYVTEGGIILESSLMPRTSAFRVTIPSAVGSGGHCSSKEDVKEFGSVVTCGGGIETNSIHCSTPGWVSGHHGAVIETVK